MRWCSLLLLGFAAGCCPRGATAPATVVVRCHDGQAWREQAFASDRLRVVPQPGRPPDREGLRTAARAEAVAVAPGGALLVGFARVDRTGLAERARALAAVPGVQEVQAVGRDGGVFLTRRVELRAAPGQTVSALAAQEGLTLVARGSVAAPGDRAVCLAPDPLSAAAAAERLIASGRASAAVVETRVLHDDLR